MLSKKKIEINTLENEVRRVSQNIKMEEAKLIEIEEELNKYNLSIDLQN
ncbi:hypothetical protein [Bacillus sp. Cs-700]|nr:hypothetical protein [Bacillus sp. Cs-700]